MGFYIRKAIRVGPVRFNLSKSGIGVSAGIKGFRVGTGPRGNYVHVGRGGVYFRQSLNGPARRGPQPQVPEYKQSPNDSHQSGLTTRETVAPMQAIESASVLQMVDGSGRQLLEEMNEKQQMMRLFPLVASVSLLAAVICLLAEQPAWVTLASIAVGIPLCWVASSKDALRKTTVILYTMEIEQERAYELLHNSFNAMRECHRIWHIDSQAAVLNQKYHAGASALVRRSAISPRLGQPPFVRTNIEIPLLPVGRQILAFMPDRLLVFERGSVGGVAYKDLIAHLQENRFIESGGVPRDATVVDKTWRYVNKNGGPDRRFNNNAEIPICLYDELHLKSYSGLNELIQLSARGRGRHLADALKKMASLPKESSQ